jgi:protein-S-isoprenylcysteine O-methyltransferase Ste14
VNDLIGSWGTARALLVASFAALLVSEISIRLRGLGKRRGVLEDRGSIIAVVVGIGAGGLVAGWCSARVPAVAIPGSRFTLALAVALMWSGIVLRQWAVWALGRFFTVVVRVADAQRVVDRGPFRWVRHPSYTGLLLTFLGIGLAVGNWLSLASLVIFPLMGLIVRIRVEERALLASLKGYREYASDRRRLIPGLW